MHSTSSHAALSFKLGKNRSVLCYKQNDSPALSYALWFVEYSLLEYYCQFQRL